MNNRILGLILVLCGICFLMLTLALNISGFLFFILLGSSIILNISGVSAIMKFISNEKVTC
ncbi:hypothetical protein [Priestia megaterium]